MSWTREYWKGNHRPIVRRNSKGRFIEGHRHMPPEWKKSISKGYKGKPFSKEHRENLSKSLTGRAFSKEHKERIAKSNRGKIISKETREKLKKASKGNQYALGHTMKYTEELKKRKSEIMKETWKRKKSKEEK